MKKQRTITHRVLAIALVLLLAMSAPAFAAVDVTLTTDVTYLRQGVTFNLNATFTEVVQTNALTLTFEADNDLFELVSYTAPAGTMSLIPPTHVNDQIKITLMCTTWSVQGLGSLTLKVKDDAVLPEESQPMSLAVDYVTMQGVQEKKIAELDIGVFVPTSLLQLTSDKYIVYGDEQFVLTPAFREETNSNTAILHFTYDKAKFTYTDFIGDSSVQFLRAQETDTGVDVYVMMHNYNATELGGVVFYANDRDATEDNVISVVAEYVELKDGNKVINTANAKVTITHFEIPETFDLVFLSDMVDAYGSDENSEAWAEWKFFDFNRSGDIDVFDISYVAQRIA